MLLLRRNSENVFGQAQSFPCSGLWSDWCNTLSQSLLMHWLGNVLVCFHRYSSLTTDILTLLPIVSMSLFELNKQTFLYAPRLRCWRVWCWQRRIHSGKYISSTCLLMLFLISLLTVSSLTLPPHWRLVFTLARPWLLSWCLFPVLPRFAAPFPAFLTISFPRYLTAHFGECYALSVSLLSNYWQTSIGCSSGAWGWARAQVRKIPTSSGIVSSQL